MRLPERKLICTLSAVERDFEKRVLLLAVDCLTEVSENEIPFPGRTRGAPASLDHDDLPAAIYLYGHFSIFDDVAAGFRGACGNRADGARG